MPAARARARQPSGSPAERAAWAVAAKSSTQQAARDSPRVLPRRDRLCEAAIEVGLT